MCVGLCAVCLGMRSVLCCVLCAVLCVVLWDVGCHVCLCTVYSYVFACEQFRMEWFTMCTEACILLCAMCCVVGSCFILVVRRIVPCMVCCVVCVCVPPKKGTLRCGVCCVLCCLFSLSAVMSAARRDWHCVLPCMLRFALSAFCVGWCVLFVMACLLHVVRRVV